MNKRSRMGFTLIELLIVATIIVILTVIVVLNLEKAQAKSRDAQRKADLSKVAAALEMYKVDNKVYIAKDSFGGITTDVIPEIYLAVIPTDPTNDATHIYEYKGDTAQYKLRVLSETISTSDSVDTKKSKAGDFYDPDHSTYFQISTSATALAW